MAGARWWLKFAVVQTVLTLVLVEIALQIYNPLPFRVRGDRIVLPVHRHTTIHNSGPRLDPVVHQQRNSLGFRGPEPPRDLASRLSIITIGGSTTECRLLTDGKTWTDVLASRLAPVIPNVWVNNAGFDGQSTHGHLILLRQEIVRLRPTVALFLVGANDISADPTGRQLRVGEPRREDEALMPTPSWRHRITSAAVNHVELLGIVQNLYRYQRARRQGLGHAWTSIDVAPALVMSEDEIDAIVDQARPMAEDFRRRVEEIVKVCREGGIEPVFVTQPALYPAVDLHTGKNTATLRVSERGSGALDWRLTELNNDATRAVASREGLLLIDLAREMPHDSRLYYDFVHFSNAGAEKVGEILAAHVGPYLQERFSDRVQPR